MAREEGAVSLLMREDPSMTSKTDGEKDSGGRACSTFHSSSSKDFPSQRPCQAREPP